MVAPKQFSAPGVMLSPDKQNAVTQQATRLPNQPLNPALMMNMGQYPTYQSPNATASPGMPGLNNDPLQKSVLGYQQPGGNSNFWDAAKQSGKGLWYGISQGLGR